MSEAMNAMTLRLARFAITASALLFVAGKPSFRRRCEMNYDVSTIRALDALFRTRKRHKSMNKLLLAAPLSLAVLLAACGEPAPIVANGPADPTQADVANAPPVKLPPALLDSKTYRCQPGNALFYVDWFNDNTSANLKTKKDAAPIAVTAPAAGQPFVGGGYTITGAPAGASVTIDGPSGKLTCTG
jgi:hypothetical protein